MVLRGFVPECFVQTGFKSTVHPTGRGEKNNNNNKNVPCPSISPASPTQEREAWGHRERSAESWDMRAGRDFRGQLVQHQISQIRKMRFREFTAQSHKAYMRPDIGSRAWHIKVRRQISVPLALLAHPLPCVRDGCRHTLHCGS